MPRRKQPPRPVTGAPPQLTPALQAKVRQVVDAAPKVAAATREKLGLLLQPGK